MIKSFLHSWDKITLDNNNNKSILQPFQDSSCSISEHVTRDVPLCLREKSLQDITPHKLPNVS